MAGGLIFDAVTHAYVKDGRPVWQSVTQVLERAGLFEWMRSIPEPVISRARQRGKTVHTAIHYFNENDLDLDDFREHYPALVGYLEGWRLFCERERFVAVLNEHRLYSARYDLAGTLDCLGLLNGQAALVDFATGDPLDVAKDLQTAAYLLLAREWASEDAALDAFLSAHPVVRRYAVQLRPDCTIRVEPFVDPADSRHFLTLVEAQRIVDEHAHARMEVI